MRKEIDHKFAKRSRRHTAYFLIITALTLVAATRIERQDVWFHLSAVALVGFIAATYWYDDFFRDIYRCPNAKRRCIIPE